MSMSMFTKPKAGKLSPARKVPLAKERRAERECKDAVAASVREMQWSNVIRPSARRAGR